MSIVLQVVFIKTLLITKAMFYIGDNVEDTRIVRFVKVSTKLRTDINSRKCVRIDENNITQNVMSNSLFYQIFAVRFLYI